MIDRIELIFVDEPFKVGEFQRNHAVWCEQMRHSCSEVIKVGNLSQDVIADYEICPPTLRARVVPQASIQRTRLGSGICFSPAAFGDVGGRLDAETGTLKGEKC